MASIFGYSFTLGDIRNIAVSKEDQAADALLFFLFVSQLNEIILNYHVYGLDTSHQMLRKTKIARSAED